MEYRNQKQPRARALLAGPVSSLINSIIKFNVIIKHLLCLNLILVSYLWLIFILKPDREKLFFVGCGSTGVGGFGCGLIRMPLSNYQHNTFDNLSTLFGFVFF